MNKSSCVFQDDVLKTLRKCLTDYVDKQLVVVAIVQSVVSMDYDELKKTMEQNSQGPTLLGKQDMVYIYSEVQLTYLLMRFK